MMRLSATHRTGHTTHPDKRMLASTHRRELQHYDLESDRGASHAARSTLSKEEMDFLVTGNCNDLGLSVHEFHLSMCNLGEHWQTYTASSM
jgi:hypothetical protein